VTHEVHRQKAEPVLLDFGAPRAIEIAQWSDRVQYVGASYANAGARNRRSSRRRANLIRQ
jgi:hypothetical protein